MIGSKYRYMMYVHKTGFTNTAITAILKKNTTKEIVIASITTLYIQFEFATNFLHISDVHFIIKLD